MPDFTGITWSKDPRAHIAVYQPPCTRPGCRLRCMRWARCRCGVVFGGCVEHDAGNPIDKQRAEHRCADRRAAT